ncbi:hypothetical protein TRVL_02318 [Trypanosoma vivax]|nr:hypothetical protein TRVL_02318 [Trypanosoma vivax]
MAQQFRSRCFTCIYLDVRFCFLLLITFSPHFDVFSHCEVRSVSLSRVVVTGLDEQKKQRSAADGGDRGATAVFKVVPGCSSLVECLNLFKPALLCKPVGGCIIRCHRMYAAAGLMF